MNISQESDYAIRAIRSMYKIGESNKVEARVIAEREEIPIRFLFKILRKLCKAEIIRSFRGVNGGYLINKPLDTITLKDIIEAIDGPITINKCTEDSQSCNLCIRGCSLYKEMLSMESKIKKILSEKTIKQILEEDEKVTFIHK
ncbi:Rrf2 family transcriptional regulator [uncultured Clostridium sp.]|uniref:RrF2 family transcriptional regulator n=1 Tax=uncultured Clostridium sp. TaxID=59620 RepID=UPI002624152B|nr:Rrf2 family transcriptional regulator [uncultured Clostridium sp.]